MPPRLTLLLPLAALAMAAPPSSPLDLIVLAGQSNMAGRGGVYSQGASAAAPGGFAPKPAPKKPVPAPASAPAPSKAAVAAAMLEEGGGRPAPKQWDEIIVAGDAVPADATIRLWSLAKGGDAAAEWTDAKEPLFRGAERPGKVAGIGPGLPAAAALTAFNASSAIGLVPTAEGGSALEEWEAGGALAQRSAARVAAALKAAPPGSKVRAILFYQGETDAIDPAAAATYADRLAPALAALREGAGGGDIPIVAVAIAADPRLISFYNATDGWAAVRAATLALPSKLNRTAVVDAARVGPRYMPPDGIHLDPESHVRLGGALAAALHGLEGK